MLVLGKLGKNWFLDIFEVSIKELYYWNTINFNDIRCNFKALLNIYNVYSVWDISEKWITNTFLHISIPVSCIFHNRSFQSNSNKVKCLWGTFGSRSIKDMSFSFFIRPKPSACHVMHQIRISGVTLVPRSPRILVYVDGCAAHFPVISDSESHVPSKLSAI
jgi:hypothetical protein